MAERPKKDRCGSSMNKQDNNLIRVLSAYYASTGIGLICLDKRLNITMMLPKRDYIGVLSVCGFDELTSYLTRLAADEGLSASDFYTYYMKNGFVCNIVPVAEEGLAFIVTEPFLYEKPADTKFSEPQIQRFPQLRDLPADTPVVELASIASYGVILSSLCHSLKRRFEPRQAVVYSPISGNSAPPVIPQYLNTPEDPGLSKLSSYGSAICKGDIDTMAALTSEIDAELLFGARPKHLRPAHWIRQRFTMYISMACAAAVSSGASFQKTMRYTNDLVAKTDETRQAHEFIELTKKALMHYTRSVVAGRGISYSKPVRQSMEYIKNHYSEKITLEKLSDYTNLSTYYLSNLIKKETGLSLIDNINRIRVGHAKKLLSNSNAGILEIAHQTGFSYQNHFASVFKKFTGITPTEYRKSLDGSTLTLYRPHGPVYVIAESLRRQPLFTGLDCHVRIIDPACRTSWTVERDGYEELMIPEACCRLAETCEACPDCVINKAVLQDRSIVCIEKHMDSVYFVVTAPARFGDSVYAVQSTFDVTGQFSQSLKSCAEPPAGEKRAVPYEDDYPGVCNRLYIDTFLPMFIRNGRQSGSPVSVIVGGLENWTSLCEKHGLNKIGFILESYADVMISALPSGGDWVGRYAGGIFIMVLTNTGEAEAVEISGRIRTRFSGLRFKIDGETRKAVPVTSVICLNDLNDLAVKTAVLDVLNKTKGFVMES